MCFFIKKQFQNALQCGKTTIQDGRYAWKETLIIQNVKILLDSQINSKWTTILVNVFTHVDKSAH